MVDEILTTQNPSKKYTQLPAAALPLDGSEIIALVQGGVSKQAAISDIPGGGGGGGTPGGLNGQVQYNNAGVFGGYTASQLTSVVNVMVGDSGSGGTKGLVPAPVAGDAAKFLRGDGTFQAVAGSGTVTNVSVVTANGVSGSVANSTTTPAITLTLGAITPSSVASVGTVTGSNLSGTNTGDQFLFRTIAVSGQSDIVADSTTDTLTLVAGTNITITTDPTTDALTINSSGGGGSGTVTSVSVVTANGFAGSVATATTTPAITLSTSVTGVLKGNGTAISAASAGTDYQAPITLTTTGTSGAATFIANTLNIPQYSGGGGGGTVTTTGSPSNGNLSVFSGATSITNGDLSGDITTSGTLATTLATVNGNVGSFGSSTAIPSVTVNAKGLVTAASTNAVVAPAGTLTGTTLAANVVTSSLTSLGTLSGLTMGGTLAMGANNITSTGSLGTTGSRLTKGWFTDLQVTNAIAGSVTGNAATATALATGRTIAITGDLAYTSPSFDGSGNVTAAGTLATVNSNVGSFTNANITVNAKGLITSASTGSGGSGSTIGMVYAIASGNLLF